jgi:hypothetical protein
MYLCDRSSRTFELQSINWHPQGPSGGLGTGCRSGGGDAYSIKTPFMRIYGCCHWGNYLEWAGQDALCPVCHFLKTEAA